MSSDSTSLRDIFVSLVENYQPCLRGGPFNAFTISYHASSKFVEAFLASFTDFYDVGRFDPMEHPSNLYVQMKEILIEWCFLHSLVTSHPAVHKRKLFEFLKIAAVMTISV